MDKIKVLNLYAGIGGNRKKWQNVEVTAVENNKDIAAIYKSFFPSDKMIISDAHAYLLKHFKQFDFIWSSPPCPTHSRLQNLKNNFDEYKKVYPDMKLYEEIIFLKHFYKGRFCVENVISYYKPLLNPIESGSHYYWTNFYFKPLENQTRFILSKDKNKRETLININLDKFKLKSNLKRKIINNCVEPDHGLYVFNSAFNSFPDVQLDLNLSEV